MDNKESYNYWEQPQDLYADQNDQEDGGYEPEVENEKEPEFNENIDNLKNNVVDPTFMESVKMDWDKSKHSVWVVEALKQGSHHSYKIKGNYKGAEFDIVRRFREFYALRNTLRKRWAGFYIPGIPPKKPLGNKEDSLVNERWHLFNKFVQELSLISHLWESEEVEWFIRPKLDVEKGLNLMGRMTSDNILERLATHAGIDYMTANSTTSKYKDMLRDFVASSKEVLKFLDNFKEFAKSTEHIRKMKIIAHTKLGGFLNRYEENTVAVYGLANFSNNRVVSNTDDSSVRDALDSIPKQLDNPYVKLKHWIKEEIIELHSLIEAIGQRDIIECWKNKAEGKRRSSQSELDKLNAGKKTFKTMFKSASSKANQVTTLTQSIAQSSIDVENFEKAIVYVETYLGDIAIPSFKKKTVHAYYSVMKDISGSEQSNFSNTLESWKVIYNAFNQKLV